MNKEDIEEYSKKVNEFSCQFLSQDLIIKKQQQELERYKNIIDELEKFLNYHIYCNFNEKMTEAYKDSLDKLKELKGSDN